ncbi:class I SAM-dependent methyltransferase [Lacrimispora indolis]|uniref:class I SAM-dependent methyltransferase n=1 Tax=Lacrimispora indolis TaxID=69825 RepID=UPI00040B67F5|nr:class I SAM-dependent methyltransferase [[Clostridium] methoxybenzovorans]
MSNYYDYREVKVMIAHRLMALDGWKVYDYSPDQSDSMTDYYCPATWGGIAEKNGYVLCVDVYGAREAQEIRKYNYTGFSYDSSITDKIKKLEAMTVERGASEQEEQSAKIMIERLQKKAEENADNQSKYIVTGMIPGHQAHPNKCNWHIEKDGIIIAKGNGILKYSEIYYKENYKMQTEKEIREEIIRRNSGSSWFNDEELEKSVKYQLEDQEKTLKLKNDFDKFINKLDTTCGGLLGEGEGFIYEKVTVTEYKKENKVFETITGEIKEGQCFILKSNFNYGCYKGLVYRIHETVYNTPEKGETKHYHAYKLNGKLTKECTGQANTNNRFGLYNTEKFMKWIQDGSIAWCEIKEVKTPYEIEKVVKKSISSKTEERKAEQKADQNTKETKTTVNAAYTYDIAEDIDTRDDSKIWVVKVKEKVEDFSALRAEMKKVDAYYSKFKHGFIFKYDPTEVLNRGKDVETEESTEFNQSAQPRQQDRAKIIERINKAISSTQNKIDKLSGDYKTNTYKRMREQEGREAKIQGYKLDINILSYLLDTAQERSLTALETALITDAFRDTMHTYYRRFETWSMTESERPSSATPVTYPEVDLNYPNSWWNEEVPKRQKRLQKANISNTEELIESIKEYKVIIDLVNKPQDQTTLKIKRLEREYKMQQKGDVNFTPSEVAKQLIEYARINENSRVLEPSAGIGNIADQIKQHTNNIDVCEKMYHFNQLLELKGYKVVGTDFLEYETDNKYDAIIMNPPFSDEQNHIKHAYDLLKNGGILVSISSPHWTFAKDRKSVEFREWLEDEMYFTEDLKSGTFEMTGVTSKIIVIEKRERDNIKTA